MLFLSINVYSSFVHSSWKWKQPKCPSKVGWINKWFSTRGGFALQGAFGNVWRNCLSQWENEVLWHPLVYDQGCCKTSSSTEAPVAVAPRARNLGINKLESIHTRAHLSNTKWRTADICSTTASPPTCSACPPCRGKSKRCFPCRSLQEKTQNHYTLWKKTDTKEYVLHYSTCTKF